MNQITYKVFVMNESLMTNEPKNLEETDIAKYINAVVKLFREKRLNKKQNQQAVDSIKKNQIEEDKLKNEKKKVEEEEKSVQEGAILDLGKNLGKKLKDKFDSIKTNRIKNQQKESIRKFKEKSEAGKLVNRTKKAASAGVSDVASAFKTPQKFAERMANRAKVISTIKGGSSND